MASKLSRIIDLIIIIMVLRATTQNKREKHWGPEILRGCRVIRVFRIILLESKTFSKRYRRIVEIVGVALGRNLRSNS